MSPADATTHALPHVDAQRPAPRSGAPHGTVTGGVRALLQLEGLAVFAVTTMLYVATGRGWGLYLMVFFTPDVSFLAYALGARAGAIAYDALHTYLGPIALVAAAQLLRQPALLPWAYAWAAHCGFDRMLGYGLKYATAFGDTHLGHKGPGADA